MAWEICISAEGWQEIEDTLQQWTTKDLAVALACDDAEAFDDQFNPSLERLEQYEGYQTSFYRELAHETLAREALERIMKHNTCDNGGNGYYIDRDGYHRVYVSEGN